MALVQDSRALETKQVSTVEPANLTHRRREPDGRESQSSASLLQRAPATGAAERTTLQKLKDACHDVRTALQPRELCQEAVRQATRQKCAFCLGLSTCLLAVTTAAAMQSVLGSAPAAFLRQAELAVGETDVVVTAPRGQVFNFSKVREAIAASEYGVSHATPRHFFGAKVPVGKPALYNWLYEVPVWAWDTESDKFAGVGRTWELPPIPYGQAIVSKQLADLLDVSPGDKISLGIDVSSILGRYLAHDDALTHPFTETYAYRRVNSTQFVDATCFNSIFGADLSTGHSHAARCTGETPRPLFCGTITNNSACGMFYQLHFDLTVAENGIIDNWKGRYAPKKSDSDSSESSQSVSSSTIAVMELKHLMRLVYEALPSEAQQFLLPRLVARGGAPFGASLSNTERDAILESMSFDAVSNIIVNMPPDVRSSRLISTEYTEVRDRVVDFSGHVVNSLGLLSVSINNPIIRELQTMRYMVLYLGLVLDILVIILLCLSSILIYSLMMINVQKRTFEIAVRRMLGSTTIQVVFLLATQALSYALPALFFGLLFAHGLARSMFQQVYNMGGMNLEGGLTASGAGYGIMLGLAIPLIGAIGPIRTALGLNLRDSLDVSRPRMSAVIYNIITAADRSRMSVPLVIIGVSLSTFGFMIYYLLPLSLLSADLKLFFNIFFSILIGMIFGLTLLAINLEQSVERGLTFMLLFWVPRVYRQLALKNLIAHRQRNRKTSIMYALSLAFVIFIAVASQMEVQTFRYRRLQSAGGEMAVYRTGDEPGTLAGGLAMTVGAFRRLRGALEEDPSVEAVAWASNRLRRSTVDRSYKLQNRGGTYSVLTADSRISTVSPNYFDVASQEFLIQGSVWQDKQGDVSGLSLGEQLYTVRGSQGILLATAYRTELNLKDIERQNATEPVAWKMTDRTTSPLFRIERTLLRPMIYMDAGPGFEFHPRVVDDCETVVSPRTFMRLADGQINRLDAIPIRRILIKLKPGTKASDRERIERSFQVARRTGATLAVYLWDIQDEIANFGQTMQMIDFFFSALTVVGLTLCFFSLVASMITNIHEQSQDIAILRSMGLTRREVVIVYILEAFILVMGAATLGIMIGYFIGWTFSSQRTVFTQLPLTFAAPYGIVITVFVCAIICAGLAAGIPASKMLRLDIAQLLRFFG